MAGRGSTSKAARGRSPDQALQPANGPAAGALQRAPRAAADGDPPTDASGLSDVMKRGTHGTLETFTSALSQHTSDGVDPLRKCTPTSEGAFVVNNHKEELKGKLAAFLFGKLMARLRRTADPPTVDDYRAHKGSVSTARRAKLEMESLWDPYRKKLCTVKALRGARARSDPWAHGRARTDPWSPFCAAGSDVPRRPDRSGP